MMPWLAMLVTASLHRAYQSHDETFLGDQSLYKKIDSFCYALLALRTRKTQSKQSVVHTIHTLRLIGKHHK
jgi:hypothetical protein